jgi:hypothetical protein
MYLHNLGDAESIGKRIEVPWQPHAETQIYLNNDSIEKAWAVAQVIDQLPRTQEALSSNPGPIKNLKQSYVYIEYEIGLRMKEGKRRIYSTNTLWITKRQNQFQLNKKLKCEW